MTAPSYTYATLTAAVQTWIDDTDVDWTAATPLAQLVALAEDRVVRDMDLTVFDTISTAQTATLAGKGVVARPAGIIVTDELGYNSLTLLKFTPLERRDISFIYDYLDPAIKGPPQYYAELDATNWQLAPYPDQTYTLVNWGPYAPASLNDGSSATWLSSNLAVLLFTAMQVEVLIVLKSEARRQVALGEYMAKLASYKLLFRALRRKNVNVLKAEGLESPEGKTPGSNPTQE
jgi:hypothetical protein